MSLSDDVRRSCAEIAAGARSVRIDLDALATLDPGPPPRLDAEAHYLEGPPEDVATYILTLDTINFGSGWFPTIRKRRAPDGRPLSGYFTTAWALSDRFRRDGPWSNAELRAMRTEELAAVLGQRADHELMALYAQALRQLGVFLGDRHALDVVAAEGSAVRLAAQLVNGMAMYGDHGFYKRAQIVPNDLDLAGVARFADLDRLTIFADNLVPHVLRCDGVLVLDERLAAHIDAGRELRPGPQERELRACAVHACALIAERTGLSERDVDNALWARGQLPSYKAQPRPRCRTVFY
jgi:Potential Queuosine, Q, salvage protein family